MKTSLAGSCADIIVVGGGGAALSAAAEAARLGCRVMVVEKNAELGGSTRLSAGLLAAAGTHLQARAGINDSADLHDAELARLIREQGIADNAELRRLLTDNAADTVDFLISIGADFFGPLEHPPFKAKRFHQILPDGRAYIYRLERHCRSLGVEFRLRRRARRLLRPAGRVTGVEVESPAGESESLSAAAGVILATGDFSANGELRSKFMGRGTEAVAAYNRSATGDGHLMALELGARMVPRPDLGPSAGTIAFPPPAGTSLLLSLPPYRILTLAMKFAMTHLPAWLVRPFVLKAALANLPIESAFYQEGAILINRNAERFVDEIRVTGTDIAMQPGGEAFVLFDGPIAARFSAWPHYVSAAPGVAFAYVDDYRRSRGDIFYRAGSAESLAAQLGLPAARMKAALCSRNSPDGAQRPGTAPYFALGPLVARVRHVPIGLGVNAKLQVLAESGDPIPGLFAAGDTGQGGFVSIGHGHNLAWALTTGRLAARSAALELRRSNLELF